MSAAKRILVTGGTGFIGRYAVERLRTQGPEPLVTTSGEPATTENDGNGLIALDLTDAAATERVISSNKPDLVLHLGGITGSGTSGDRCHAVNYVGTVNLLKALEKTAFSRVILLGTAAEYGHQSRPYREEMITQPVSPYAVSKAKANEFALEMHSRSGFPVTILRVFTAYGYGQPRKMFLSQLVTHALLRQRFNMSDGQQLRDFIFVGDVVDAILAAIATERSVGRAINIAGGRGIALKDLAEKVWDLCAADPEMLQIGSLEKTGDDVFDTEADISLAAELLGWRPATPFIGDAANGHPLVEMIERMKHELEPFAEASTSPGQ